MSALRKWLREERASEHEADCIAEMYRRGLVGPIFPGDGEPLAEEQLTYRQIIDDCDRAALENLVQWQKAYFGG